jgi:hypothetical protein
MNSDVCDTLSDALTGAGGRLVQISSVLYPDWSEAKPQRLPTLILPNGWGDFGDRDHQ